MVWHVCHRKFRSPAIHRPNSKGRADCATRKMVFIAGTDIWAIRLRLIYGTNGGTRLPRAVSRGEGWLRVDSSTQSIGGSLLAGGDPTCRRRQGSESMVERGLQQPLPANRSGGVHSRESDRRDGCGECGDEAIKRACPLAKNTYKVQIAKNLVKRAIQACATPD
jgi:hypothetical protein